MITTEVFGRAFYGYEEEYLHSTPKRFWPVANVTEAGVYLYTKHISFLSPAYTIAIAIFQRYEGELEPTQQEVIDFFARYEIALYNPAYRHSAHASGYYNWRKTDRGLVLIDYAVDPMRDNWIRMIRRLDVCIEGEKKGMKPSDLFAPL